MIPELSFTRYWSEEEKAKAEPLITEVLEDFPEFPIDEIRIGSTGSAHGRFQRQRDHNHDLYIQLNPQELSKFTVAHELHHHLTRERAIDLRTISMGPDYQDSKPFYLSELEGCRDLKNFMERNPKLVTKWAKMSLEQDDVEPVKHFQNLMKSRSKFAEIKEIPE